MRRNRRALATIQRVSRSLVGPMAGLPAGRPTGAEGDEIHKVAYIATALPTSFSK